MPRNQPSPGTSRVRRRSFLTRMKLPCHPTPTPGPASFAVGRPAAFCKRSRVSARLLIGLLLALVAFRETGRAAGTAAAEAERAGQVIEAAGQVDFVAAGRTNWIAVTNGWALGPGDRLRTGPASRAAVLFSDRSRLRLGESTVLEIQAPRRAEKRRFGLGRGLLFFFDRERPADIEFETPVATGAIRGTEFVLAAEADGATRLSLLDGRVELAAAGQSLELAAGEQGEVAPGEAPRKTAMINAANVIQWALYYPAVLLPDDLALTAEERRELNGVLATYQAGDLLAAGRAMESLSTGAPAREEFRAALALAVGRLEAAEAALGAGHADTPGARALREMIDVVRGKTASLGIDGTPGSASEWLARSYLLQARFELKAARTAAQRAQQLAPGSGFAAARLAELEWALERRPEALAALALAVAASPRLASAHALEGFIELDRNRPAVALERFEAARALDAALGTAWLGRGLALLRLGRRDDALGSLATAVALEPRRALFRSYLGKGWIQAGARPLAERELGLARTLDPADPTAWLYAALLHWQENRPQAAVRELEESVARNAGRRLFRSRLGLDRDGAVRSADLAAVYRDAGLVEAGQASAARAVNEDYANYAGHLFLARSLQELEDPRRYDLRYESARQSELLLANLLAPVGEGNLSQRFSQQERLRFFDPPAIGVSSFTEYRSAGDWRQWLSAFGTVDNSSYALDTAYESEAGDDPNGGRERGDISLQFKQRLGERDELYVQTAFALGQSGDVARHYDPAEAKTGLAVTEEQIPQIYLGWHRAWSPASHSLLLVSRLSDDLTLDDTGAQVLALYQSGGTVRRVSTSEPGFALHEASGMAIYSAEAQQLWQSDRHALVVGGRWQAGTVDALARLDRDLTGTVTDDHVEEPMRRGNAYLYEHWHPWEPLRLVLGVSYDHLEFPVNADLAPLTAGTDRCDVVAPKAGLVFEPWRQGTLRADYTRSLGGLSFDNSVRLEPTEVAGFNQALRSLLPDAVTGQVPGTEFETAGVGFDQALRTGTHLGAELQWLRSDGERVVGALSNSLPVPVPDTPTSTRQTLDGEVRQAAAYLVQSVGDGFSAGVRYAIEEATLNTRFPDLPRSTIGLDQVEQDERAVLERVALTLAYQHPAGAFGEWESTWYRQRTDGFDPARPVSEFWQHNLWIGWRFAQRRAEVRLGVLNLADQDYRLTPLNAYRSLPRERTFVVSLRLNF